MKAKIHFLAAGLALGLALAPNIQAQSKDELQKKYEEKLTHKFVEFGGWTTDFDAARARAKKEDKVLFVYFSRSYAP